MFSLEKILLLFAAINLICQRHSLSMTLKKGQQFQKNQQTAHLKNTMDEIQQQLKQNRTGQNLLKNRERTNNLESGEEDATRETQAAHNKSFASTPSESFSPLSEAEVEADRSNKSKPGTKHVAN